MTHVWTSTDRSDRATSTDELVRRWRENADHHARRELCDRFLPLARRLASRYQRANEPLEDLVQVASVGLLGAIERFDPDRGTSFVSFAIPTILGELKRHFRNTGWSLHVPRGAQEMAMRVDRGSREITERTGRPPQISQLAAYLEVTVEDVLDGLDAGNAHYSASLDAPASNSADEPQSLADTIGADDDGFGLVEAKLSLPEAISRLPYLERQALSMRINGDLRQVEIAQQLGCSQMQVSRLLRRAATRLRTSTYPDAATPHRAHRDPVARQWTASM
jgi:RNA polymerase sigma-B factor